MGHAWGLDPWASALERARTKAHAYGLDNVELIEGRAEAMPFEDRNFDLLVSNNGLNNVSDTQAALRECARVARPGAQLVMTVNLPGTFAVFYEFLEMLFDERRWTESVKALHDHIAAKRKPAQEWVRLLEEANFTLRKTKEASFTWSFLNGRALFGHWFIRLFFLNTWRELVPEAHREEFMTFLQGRLDRLALERGGLHLEVPYVCLDAQKIR
jgi:SAM-dependent methyltransferase